MNLCISLVLAFLIAVFNFAHAAPAGEYIHPYSDGQVVVIASHKQPALVRTKKIMEAPVESIEYSPDQQAVFEHYPIHRQPVAKAVPLLHPVVPVVKRQPKLKVVKRHKRAMGTQEDPNEFQKAGPVEKTKLARAPRSGDRLQSFRSADSKHGSRHRVRYPENDEEERDEDDNGYEKTRKGSVKYTGRTQPKLRNNKALETGQNGAEPVATTTEAPDTYEEESNSTTTPTSIEMSTMAPDASALQYPAQPEIEEQSSQEDRDTKPFLDSAVGEPQAAAFNDNADASSTDAVVDIGDSQTTEIVYPEEPSTDATTTQAALQEESGAEEPHGEPGASTENTLQQTEDVIVEATTESAPQAETIDASYPVERAVRASLVKLPPLKERFARQADTETETSEPYPEYKSECDLLEPHEQLTVSYSELQTLTITWPDGEQVANESDSTSHYIVRYGLLNGDILLENNAQYLVVPQTSGNNTFTIHHLSRNLSYGVQMCANTTSFEPGFFDGGNFSWAAEAPTYRVYFFFENKPLNEK